MEQKPDNNEDFLHQADSDLVAILRLEIPRIRGTASGNQLSIDDEDDTRMSVED